VTEKNTESATMTFFVRALRGEGVQSITPSAGGGWASDLIGGGTVRVTRTRVWKTLLEEWHQQQDPDVGWRALAFREFGTGRPLVLASAVSLGRLVALTEQFAAESGRLESR
jgi:hypothetical protein